MSSSQQIVHLQNDNSIFKNQNGETIIIVNQSPLTSPLNSPESGQITPIINTPTNYDVKSPPYIIVNSQEYSKATEHLKNKQEYNKKYYQEKTKQKRANEKNEYRELQETVSGYKNIIMELEEKIRQMSVIMADQQTKINRLISYSTPLPKVL